MPEEPYGRERVFDIPDEPAPFVPPAPKQPAPKPAAAPAPSGGGDSGVWQRLQDHYKGRLPVNHRVFLNMVQGVLEGDCLTLYCPTEFARDSLNNNTVLDVLKDVTSADVGHPIRVEFKIGSAPKTGAAPKPKATPAPKAAVAEPVKAAEPAQTPPWEETPPTRDRLDELVAPAQKLENFKIK